MSARTLAGLSPVILAAVLLVGTSCSSDDPTTAVLPVPRIGQCHVPAPGALRSDKVDDSPPVACTQPHTLETVGVVGSAAKPSTASYRVLTHRCRVAAKHYLGMGAEENYTLAFPFIYLPDAEQSAAGQDWVRCDVGVRAETECCSALVTETSSVRDVVARDPADFGECIDQLPAPHPAACRWSRAGSRIAPSCSGRRYGCTPVSTRCPDRWQREGQTRRQRSWPIALIARG